VCQILLQHHADASLVSENRSTPLHYLVKKDLFGTGSNSKQKHSHIPSPKSKTTQNSNSSNNNSSSSSIAAKKTIGKLLGKLKSKTLQISGDDLPDQVVELLIKQVQKLPYSLTHL
jgi:hypothetical protein